MKIRDEMALRSIFWYTGATGLVLCRGRRRGEGSGCA